MAIEIVDFPIKNGYFHSFVYVHQWLIIWCFEIHRKNNFGIALAPSQTESVGLTDW